MRATRRADVEPIEQRVVDAALALAAEDGWEQVRLSTIADRTGLPLAEIGRDFRDVDAIANAWFARARLAMLALTTEELAGRLADERIALAFIAWLNGRHLCGSRQQSEFIEQHNEGQFLRHRMPQHLRRRLRIDAEPPRRIAEDHARDHAARRRRGCPASMCQAAAQTSRSATVTIAVSSLA